MAMNLAMTFCPCCQDPLKTAHPHFGGFSCRACAAFFRRFVHSPKDFPVCSCKNGKSNAHPCRYCRMARCLAVGMKKSNVQKKGIRDSSTSLSLLNCQIIPRDSPHMSSTITFWPTFEKKRNELYEGFNFHEVNIYIHTSWVKPNSRYLWALISTIFPQMDELIDCDKNALLSNFIPKWKLFEPVIDFEKNEKIFKERGKTVDDSVSDYYSTGIYKNLSQEAIRIFGQFWDFYYLSVILPIAKRKFDEAEYMALILLLFFDNAYTNISKDCGRMCEAIRKVILRELRGYQKDKNSDEMRFLDTVETLLIIDKGEWKFEEEMLICDMHNVRIHEDFREMIKRSGY